MPSNRLRVASAIMIPVLLLGTFFVLAYMSRVPQGGSAFEERETTIATSTTSISLSTSTATSTATVTSTSTIITLVGAAPYSYLLGSTVVNSTLYYWAKNGTTSAIDFGGMPGSSCGYLAGNGPSCGGAPGRNPTDVLQASEDALTRGGVIWISPWYNATSLTVANSHVTIESEITALYGTGNGSLALSAGVVSIGSVVLNSTQSTVMGVTLEGLSMRSLVFFASGPAHQITGVNVDDDAVSRRAYNQGVAFVGQDGGQPNDINFNDLFLGNSFATTGSGPATGGITINGSLGAGQIFMNNLDYHANVNQTVMIQVNSRMEPLLEINGGSYVAWYNSTNGYGSNAEYYGYNSTLMQLAANLPLNPNSSSISVDISNMWFELHGPITFARLEQNQLVGNYGGITALINIHDNTIVYPSYLGPSYLLVNYNVLNNWRYGINSFDFDDNNVQTFGNSSAQRFSLDVATFGQQGQLLNGQINARGFYVSIENNDYLNLPTVPPASPLASATPYQNTYGEEVTIYESVYASGSQGEITVSLGVFNSGLTVLFQEAVPSTATQSQPLLLTLTVPSGYYYEFTASNAALGSCTIEGTES